MKGTLQQLEKALAGDAWPAVVVVTGEDADAHGRVLEKVVAAIPDEERAAAIERMTDAPPARVFDAARTAPLFGGRRLVVVSNVDWLGAGGDEGAQKDLAQYLDRPPGHATLVILSPKADRRLGVVKLLEEKAFFIDCPLPKEREMAGWLAERARERGLGLAPPAAQLLADAVGTDTGLGARELDKLALLVDAGEALSGTRKGAAVGAELVEQALGPSRAAGAFALEDALLAGRGPAALDLLDRHLAGADGGAPLMLLGRMAAVVRRLAIAAGVVGRGGGEADVQKALGGHPFVAQKYAQAARRVGARADRAMAACVVADGMLKSGRDPHAALTRIVLALTAPESA